MFFLHLKNLVKEKNPKQFSSKDKINQQNEIRILT